MFTARALFWNSQIPTKRAVILIRWPVVLVCSYLLIYSNLKILFPTAVVLLPLLFVVSNIVLYYLQEDYLSRTRVLSALVVFDTLVLTLCLVAHGSVDSDLYLTYFLIIIISCLLQDLRSLAVVTVLAPVIYGSLLFRFSGGSNTEVYLRLPFLFITSLFFGYFAYVIRSERALREHSEKENRAKMEIYNVVSHEFRTPLSVIRGFIQLIKDRYMGDINENQEKGLDAALQQCDDLEFTITNILEAGRVASDAARIEKDEINLPQFVAEIKANYDSSSPLRIVPIHWDYSPQPPLSVMSDKAKLKVIVHNLINNSIRFTKHGEIRISVRYCAESKRLELQVVDTGIGIPQEAHSLIFEQFRQLDSSNTRSFEGIGLGLYIVKEFSKMLGGDVSVESEIGRGSTFKVVIPVELPAENGLQANDLIPRQTEAYGH
jgi:signal transduction histidine kinase